MNILMIHGDRRGPGEGGGAESLLRDQARGLKARGHNVSWWYGQGSIERAIAESEADICHLMTLHCYPMGLEPVQYLQEHGIPHVWHIQDYWPFCEPRMLLIQGDQGCSAVRGICDNACGGQETGYLETVNGSYIVAGNEYTADIYRRNDLRCDAVVELGVDTAMFAPGERSEAISIITSSAWPEYPVKGMHILRQALAGTGYNVNLLTGLPRDRVATELKNAHIYVFPSCYEETFGLGLCEAMASGCACIASDVAGARAQIEHDITGLLVPPRDVEALRAAIEMLVHDGQTRLRLGEAARAHAVKEHSLDAMSQRWERVYREAIENGQQKQRVRESDPGSYPGRGIIRGTGDGMGRIVDLGPVRCKHRVERG